MGIQKTLNVSADVRSWWWTKLYCSPDCDTVDLLPEYNLFAVMSTVKASRMKENIDALHIDLAEDEFHYLDLKKEMQS